MCRCALKTSPFSALVLFQTVKLNVGRTIMQARQAQELSQKELAQKINEHACIVNDYEQGRGIPNQQV